MDSYISNNLPIEHPDNIFYQDMSFTANSPWYQSNFPSNSDVFTPSPAPPLIKTDEKKEKTTKKESKKWTVDETFDLLKVMEREGGKLGKAKSDVNRVKLESYLVAKFHLKNKQQIYNKLDSLYKQYVKKKEEFKVGKSGFNQKVDWPYFEGCQKVWEVKVEILKKFVKQGKDIPAPSSNGMKQMTIVNALATDTGKDSEGIEDCGDEVEEYGTQRVVKKKKLNSGKSKSKPSLSETIQTNMIDTSATLKDLLGSNRDLIELVKQTLLVNRSSDE